MDNGNNWIAAVLQQYRMFIRLMIFLLLVLVAVGLWFNSAPTTSETHYHFNTNETDDQFFTTTNLAEENHSFNITTETVQDVHTTVKPSNISHRHDDQFFTTTNLAEENHSFNITTETVRDVHTKVKPSNISHRHDYIMALSIIDQLQTGSRNLFHLCILAALQNLKVVEPTIHESFFKLPEKDAVARFSDLYNLTLVNENLKGCLGINYSLIVPFDEATSLCEVVFVDLKKQGQTSPGWCSSDLKREQFVKSLEKRINNAARVDGEGHHIHVQKSHSACFDATGRLNFNNTFSSLRTHWMSSQDALVEGNSCGRALVIHEWRAIKITREKTYCYYYDPNFNYNNCRIHDVFRRSNRVLEAAKTFVSLLQLRKPYLGIHIRLQKIIQWDDNRKGWATLCIDKLLKAASSLRDKYGIDLNNAVAFRDYGSRGSFDCPRCSTYEKRLQIDAKLKSLGIHVAEYETVDANTAPSARRSFAAFVDIEVLSHADYLLTAGWGSYSKMVVDTFAENHQGSEAKVFSVCILNYTHGRLP